MKRLPIKYLPGTLVLLLAACSRQDAAPAPNTVSDPDLPAPPATAAATEPVPPAESGLAIKRGIAMIAQDRATFRPCDEKVELWVVDQTDGVLTQTFAQEVQNGPAMLYVEAYGERVPVAADVPAAQAYAGTLVLEEVLYAGVQGEGRGCDQAAPTYVVAARGSEPFWGVEVHEPHMLWRTPEMQLTLGAPQTQDSEGAVRYSASGEGHQLELMLDAQACRDPMSGEFFAYAAKAVFDGKEFSGCARVGR